MNSSLANLSKEEWFRFRDIVDEAATHKKLSPQAESLRGHPVVLLVERYLAEGQERFIDEAAKMVALAKPGVEPDVAERHYWQVIDKS